MPGQRGIPGYRALRAVSDPLPLAERQRLAEYIAMCSVPEPNSGCWLWLGAVSRDEGRARFVLYGDHFAARLSYRAHVGAIGGAKVLHDCDNPGCVNPEHLHLGTQKQNMQECSRRARCKPPALRGEKNPRAILTEAAVRSVRERLSAGESMVSVSRSTGIAYNTVNTIKRRGTWGWL